MPGVTRPIDVIIADDHTVVRLGRGAQPVDRVGGDLHRRVEAERELGAAEVVKKLPKAVTTNADSDGEKQSQKQFQQQRQPKSRPALEQQPGQQQHQRQQAVIR